MGQTKTCLVFSLILVAVFTQSHLLKATPIMVESDLDDHFSFAFTLNTNQCSHRERLSVIFHSQGTLDFYELRLTRSEWLLLQVNGLRHDILARADVTEKGLGNGVLIRHGRRIKFTWNDDLVFVNHDSSLNGGKLQVKSCQHTVISNNRFQPMEALYFVDDFGREANQLNVWDNFGGNWEINGINASKTNPARSANPFSLKTVLTNKSPSSLTTTGHWFWHDYSVEVAVKLQGTATGGIAVYVQNAENFLLLELEPHSNLQHVPDGVVRISDVRQGKQHVLAEKKLPLENDQWYGLKFASCDGLLEAYIDNALVFRRRHRDFGHGSVGLHAVGLGEVIFDDVIVREFNIVHDEFMDPDCKQIANKRGDWQILNGELICTAGPVGSGELPTWYLDSVPRGQSVTVSAEIVEQDGTVALCSSFFDGLNYVVATYQIEGEKIVAKLIETVNGRRRILDQGTFEQSIWPMHIKTGVKHQAAWAWMPDGHVLRGLLKYEGGGFAGISVMENRVVCKSLRLEWNELNESELAVKSKFAEEKSMEDWATVGGAFTRDPYGVLWHRGVFFGYFEIELPLDFGPEMTGELTILLSKTKRESRGNYKLKVVAHQSTPFSFELLKNGHVLNSATLAVNDSNNRSLIVRCAGRSLSVEINSKPLFQVHEPSIAKPMHWGLIVKGWAGNWGDVRLASSNLFDETFSDAPAKWRVGQGVWEVTPRWACDNRWSWFGGTKSRTPILWTKQMFNGDSIVEGFVAIQQGAEFEKSYPNLNNLNVTICGNGYDLSTGYSFISAASGDRGSVLTRNGEIVAKNPLFRLPEKKELDDIYRRWFYVRIEKIGKEVHCFVDDRPVISYTDPRPLDGGAIGFWTVDNGLLLARVRLWHEKEPVRSLPENPEPLEKILKLPFPKPLTRKIGLPFVNRFDSNGTWLTPAEKGQSTAQILMEPDRNQFLRVTNMSSGGIFQAVAFDRSFTLGERPRLSFRYRISPLVKVNLYLRANGRLYCIVFTGSAQHHKTGLLMGEKKKIVLGRVPNVIADSEWHGVEIDLMEVFDGTGKYPENMLIRKVFFANFSADEYLFAGLWGNPLGVSYDVDDFALLPPR